MNKNTSDWAGATPSPWSLPEPGADFSFPETDPRAELPDEALAAASRNSFPIVAKQKSRRDSMGLAAGAAIALALGAVAFLSLSSGRQNPDQASPPTSAPSPLNELPQTHAIVPAEAAPGALAPPAMDMPHVSAAPGSSMMSGGHSMMPHATAPVVVFDGSLSEASGSAGSGNGSVGQAPAGLLQGSQSSTAASASSGAAARSVPLAEPSMTVIQGTLIPAVLETAINSEVPGFVRAVVTQDVRSFDGSRVLIPRSSRLIGEYKAAPSSGQHRIYLIWSRLVRPDGVSIAIGSPATDAAGRAGVGGRVDSHFFERLGSALLTSVMALNPFSRGGATVVVAGGEGATTAALQGSAQRPPTIRVRQGEPIRVFTARDLIFAPTDGAE